MFQCVPLMLFKSKLSRRVFALAFCLSCLQSVSAQVNEYAGQTANGAYYSIAVPEDWQAADGLVIWNHGYQGYTTTSPESNPSLGPLEDVVLEQGFAMAASSYSQTGWAVFSSHIDNQQLYEKFVELAAVPDRLFIQGASLGGIVSVRDLEAKLVPAVDGAFLMCGAVAGAENWYAAFDLRMVYEAVCNEVEGADLPTDSWSEQPDPLLGEVQFLDSLERCTGLLTVSYAGNPIIGQLLISQQQRTRLNRILELSNTDIEFLLLNMGYAVFEIPNLVNAADKLNGLRPFGNVGVDYGDEEINSVIQRSVALPSAQQLFMENYTPSGDVGGAKVVSIHTSRDGLVKVENQTALTSLMPSNQLTTAIAVEDEPSHCGFTDAEGIAAWNQLLNWVESGVQPTAEDLQLDCQLSNSDPQQCRFDPDFQFGNPLLTFPRDESATLVGSSSYNSATGRVLIESLQVEGDSSLYSLELLPPAAGSSLFTLGDVEVSGQIGLWQHRPAFFTEELLLYLPRMRILPWSPNDDEYDVYLRYTSDAGQNGLELVEFEVAE